MLLLPLCPPGFLLWQIVAALRLGVASCSCAAGGLVLLLWQVVDALLLLWQVVAALLLFRQVVAALRFAVASCSCAAGGLVLLLLKVVDAKYSG